MVNINRLLMKNNLLLKILSISPNSVMSKRCTTFYQEQMLLPNLLVMSECSVGEEGGSEEVKFNQRGRNTKTVIFTL